MILSGLRQPGREGLRLRYEEGFCCEVRRGSVGQVMIELSVINESSCTEVGSMERAR